MGSAHALAAKVAAAFAPDKEAVARMALFVVFTNCTLPVGIVFSCASGVTVAVNTAWPAELRDSEAAVAVGAGAMVTVAVRVLDGQVESPL